MAQQAREWHAKHANPTVGTGMAWYAREWRGSTVGSGQVLPLNYPQYFLPPLRAGRSEGHNLCDFILLPPPTNDDDVLGPLPRRL